MAKRIWKETISPAQLNQRFGVYSGVWMPQMDRCWLSDDGLQVTSRLLRTEWGKVEHAAISISGTFTFNGESELSWATKMEIKNELFGENRLAIEVFPKRKNLVDVMDVYHLWIFPKDFDLPFGIHPTKDKKASWIKRGFPKNADRLARNSEEMLELQRKLRQSDENWAEKFYEGIMRLTPVFLSSLEEEQTAESVEDRRNV